MFTSRIHTTFAALAAACSVALGTASVAPSAQAQIFRPDLMKQKKTICDNYRTIYEGQVEAAVQIDGNPDGQNQSDAGAAESDRQANHTLQNARKAGCGWAA